MEFVKVITSIYFFNDQFRFYSLISYHILNIISYHNKRGHVEKVKEYQQLIMKVASLGI